MELENIDSADADKLDEYFKTVAIMNGREIANYVASDILISAIGRNLTLRDAEEQIKSAIDNMEKIIAHFLQGDEMMARSFQRERNLFVDSYMEILNLRLSAIEERLDDGG
ncbi:MAG: hypothetical protein OXJ55_07235 [Caldilineaceae bacterium]|nr:hypothetical protein [Caldilineaceae bacterium]MDE0462904.1 hypothetical protein [Caldilineaceae bacterium]